MLKRITVGVYLLLACIGMALAIYHHLPHFNAKHLGMAKTVAVQQNQ